MNIIKSKAIYFLARREYAYKELFSKLKKYSEDLGEIKLVLDDLKRKGFLSEERYIQSYINSKKNKYGLEIPKLFSPVKCPTIAIFFILFIFFIYFF